MYSVSLSIVVSLQGKVSGTHVVVLSLDVAHIQSRLGLGEECMAFR